VNTPSFFDRDGAPHDLHRIHRKMWIKEKLVDILPSDQAIHLKPLIFHFVLDATKGDYWRFTARELEDTAEQDTKIREFDARVRLYPRNHLV
jgi:hypothetical protein